MNEEGQIYLGFDIGGTKTAVSISSIAGGILSRKAFPTEGYLGPEDATRRMIEAGHQLLSDQPAKVSGIGISVGAMFDPADGRFGAAPHLPGWTGHPIVEALRSAFSLPVAADNDANACALAEWRFGAGQGVDHLAFLTFGTGLGAGLILNSQLYGGRSNLAGEIGATRVAESGPPVRDKPGCLEGFASGAGIAGLAARVLTQHSDKATVLVDGATAKDVADGALAGDELCLAILDEAGDKLGRGLAILLDLLNLEMVVIGSIFARCEDLLRPSMEAALERDAMPLARRDCRIVSATLGEQIGDYAALALASASR